MHPENDAILEKGYLSQIEPIKEASFLWDGIAHFTRLLRPSFLTIASSSHRNTKLRRTAYLDGIRGVAALLVYVLHHELWAHAFYDGDVKLENSFGHKGKYYLGAFWGLRTFFTGGHYAVSTFFVLSGYVLSAKPLALIQAGEFLQLNDTVASALFRRWLRLFLPIIITTWMILTFYHVTGITGTFKPEKTYFGELWKWYAEGKNFTFIFTTGGEPWFTYNPHTWSIPVEMKGSIVIYTSVMAFSRLSQRGRLWAEVLLAVYFMYVADGAHFSMFVAGMFICDLETLHLNNKLPSWFTEIGGRHQNAMFHGIFALSVFLGGVPAQSSDMQQFREQPGWRWLSTLKPQAVFDFKWFYLFWAATLLVVCVPRLPWLKRFFESRFAQYLARISYSFYLVCAFSAASSCKCPSALNTAILLFASCIYSSRVESCNPPIRILQRSLSH